MTQHETVVKYKTLNVPASMMQKMHLWSGIVIVQYRMSCIPNVRKGCLQCRVKA